jgi:hypothetical protein
VNVPLTAARSRFAERINQRYDLVSDNAFIVLAARRSEIAPVASFNRVIVQVAAGVGLAAIAAA